MLALDQGIEKVLSELGSIEYPFAAGNYASVSDSELIDLVLPRKINRSRPEYLTAKTEALIWRKIGTLVVSRSEYQYLKSHFSEDPVFFLWERIPEWALL